MAKKFVGVRKRPKTPNRGRQTAMTAWTYVKLSTASHTTGVGEYASIISYCDVNALIDSLKADNEEIQVKKAVAHFTVTAAAPEYSSMTPILVRAQNGAVFTGTTSAATEIQGIANLALDKPFEMEIRRTQGQCKHSFGATAYVFKASEDVTKFVQRVARESEGIEHAPPVHILALHTTQNASVTLTGSLRLEVRYDLSPRRFRRLS